MPEDPNNTAGNDSVSVVIACHNAAGVIGKCLERLCQPGMENLQIIVADCSSDGTSVLVRDRFPQVQLLHWPEPLSLPELRGRGIAEAGGRIIALIDPYSLVAPDWLEQLRIAHTSHGSVVIGGAVDLYQEESQGILAWAQYLNEYGMFMSPVIEGEIEILPGSNISYKREALFLGEQPRYQDFWKTFVNTRVEEAGGRLWQSPGIKVGLLKPIGFWRFFFSRFSHGRCYAGMRCANSPNAERVARMLSAPLLPFLLQYRWGRRYWVKRRYRGKFLATLPIQLLLFSWWSLGEFVGYMAGPRNSCSKLHF